MQMRAETPGKKDTLLAEMRVNIELNEYDGCVWELMTFARLIKVNDNVDKM